MISSLACGLAGHLGAARLLYSMGRDDVLPRNIFGHLSNKRGNPVYNEWLVGLAAYIVVLILPWERCAEIVTFGALRAFTAVNFAALIHFWFLGSGRTQEETKKNIFQDAIVPGFGSVFCFALLLGLQRGRSMPVCFG